ncbi:FtsX-like permease family protein [Sphingomonas lenta]|uniref:ABC transporter permease n=1 Tax=Sphingomonas lenta TaxID=1141887 RepID=A0A2A2SFY7_9SPHN|nr:FtsX-like permease family protein [Sphingomonas lenta]PAX08167.1 ABC transporter permease [Sphingomonas lenta]
MKAEPGLVRSRLALSWLIAGEWRWHPLRFALTAVAIAVGVALGFAVHLVNGSALRSFDRAVTGVNGAAELAVRASSPLGFDELLYPRVALAAGVADASPVVRLRAQANGRRFDLLGLDVMRAANVTPSLVGQRPNGPDARGDEVFGEDALFLSREALAQLETRVGARVSVTANGRTVPLTVAGLLPAIGEGQAIGVLDIAAAQWRFGRLGRLDRIDLKLADRTAAEAALSDLLPADATLSGAEAEAQQGAGLSRAYRVNLDMLALVALLTGGFLVFSAQSLSVARRLRAFALLRTLGLPKRGIVAAVAAEGLLIGLIGSAAGLAIGYGLASLALRLFGGDLGAGYFNGASGRVAFQPAAAIVFFLLGLAAAVLGSVLPARAASRAAPAAALKNAGDVLDPRAPVPWRPALVLLVAGAGAALLPAVGGLPLFGFASMALLLAGGVAGVPWLARRLLGPLAKRPTARVPALLAVRHIHGAPGEAATALCGIVASTALMIAMATMVTSFRGAVDEWLGQVLAADLYLRVEGGPGFDPAAQAALRATPGVQEIAFSRQLPLTIKPERPPVTLIARAETGRPDALIGSVERVSSPPGTVPVWVSEPARRLYGWDPGETIRLPVSGGAARFHVAGVWRDYARQFGAVVLRAGDYQRLTGDATRDEAAVTLAPGVRGEGVGRAMLARLEPEQRRLTSFAAPRALRRFALELFDRSFAVTYVLEGVAILVGLAGVAATVSAQTMARTREFGMLRHLGVAKRQITAMLGLEGALLGLVGGVAGVLLGGALAQVLIHVINPQSFNFTMTTRVPWGTVAGVVAALVLAGAGTAVLAGRRATAKDAVLAVREDW